MLGDILARLTDETTAVETILGAGDLTLLAAVKEQAAADGLDLARLRRPNRAALHTRSLRRGMGHADWADEPFTKIRGRLCLKRAFEHALRA